MVYTFKVVILCLNNFLYIWTIWTWLGKYQQQFVGDIYFLSRLVHYAMYISIRVKTHNMSVSLKSSTLIYSIHCIVYSQYLLTTCKLYKSVQSI